MTNDTSEKQPQGDEQIESKWKLDPDDIIAFVTLTTVSYIAAKSLLISSMLKELESDGCLSFFYDASRVQMGTYDVSPEMVFFSILLSLSVMMFIEHFFKEKSITKSFDKAADRLTKKVFFVPVSISLFVFVFVAFFHEWIGIILIIMIACILLVLFAIEMSIGVRFSLLNTFFMFVFTFLIIISIKLDRHLEETGDSTVKNVYIETDNSLFPAHIIAVFDKDIVVRKDERTILIPRSQIKSIDFGQVGNEKATDE